MLSTTKLPRQRSLPIGFIPSSCQTVSPSRRQSTRAASTSCPSAKQSASTTTRSSTTRLAAKRPPSTQGDTFSTTARTRPSAGIARSAIVPSVREEQGRERGEGDGDRMQPTVCRQRGRLDAAEIADPASPVERRVAVERFPPDTRARHPEHVVASGHRREVAYGEDEPARVVPLAQEAQHARIGIVAVDPLESRSVEVVSMERGLRAIEPVEVGEPSLQAGVLGVLQHPPLERAVVRPFAPLAEFAAHEQQLL